MTKASDPNLEPFIDNLWYFDSVVRTKPSSKERKRGKPAIPAADAPAETAEADSVDRQISATLSELPLSTGGESSPRAASLSLYADPESDNEDTGTCEDDASMYCTSCRREGNDHQRKPSMCELVEKMEVETGELTEAELGLWMQKLGLEYTEDASMIRRIPNAEFGSQQKLDFSEFVCLNRFIEEEHGSSRKQQLHGEEDGEGEGMQTAPSFNEAHLTSLFEVFRLFDRDDSGLISPVDLRAALVKLGMRRASHIIPPV